MPDHDYEPPAFTPAEPICEAPTQSLLPGLTAPGQLTPDNAPDVAAAYGNGFVAHLCAEAPDLGTAASATSGALALKDAAHPPQFPVEQCGVSATKPGRPVTPRFGAPPDLPGPARTAAGRGATIVDVVNTTLSLPDHVGALTEARDTDARVDALTQLVIDGATYWGLSNPIASGFAGMASLVKAGEASRGGTTGADEAATQADNVRRNVGQATWPWLGEVAGGATLPLAALAEGGESLLRGVGATAGSLLGFLTNGSPDLRTPAQRRASRCLTSCHGGPAASSAERGGRGPVARPQAHLGAPVASRPLTQAEIERISTWLREVR